MDFTTFFQTVQSGGPDVIFILSCLVLLFLTGEIRVKREVEDRDHIIEKLQERNEELGTRYDKEHELFQSSLSLIRDELLPMIREDRGEGPRRSRP